ncbi:unnamed protein product [Didymodactylos carnosus]|nr:unnamed protein product [Didymodactylos carnosus]CAF3521658.1 unnamed protein product [Didymodactylos carnosus]
MFKTTSTNITHYYALPSNIDLDTYDLENIETNNLAKRIELEPGAIYKLRVAGINACGRGSFSDPSAFKTCLPGSPPAPSNIKISKTLDGGAHLTWDPPQNSSSMITGYAVYLAVKNPKDTDMSFASQKQTQMAFVRVYSGTSPDCSVPSQQLLTAHLDSSSSSKPAIIFRIAARNEKGYGPATQVRWLQDQKDNSSNINNLLSPSVSVTGGQAINFNHLVGAPTTSQSTGGAGSLKRTSSSSLQTNGAKKLRGGDT